MRTGEKTLTLRSGMEIKFSSRESLEKFLQEKKVREATLARPDALTPENRSGFVNTGRAL